MAYWFGISLTTVWRQAFGVARYDPEGSCIAHLAASNAGAEGGIKAKDWTHAEVDVKSATSKRRGCGRRIAGPSQGGRLTN